MGPLEKLHTHHEKLINTIKSLAERAIADPADTSLLLAYCNEYLVSHAEAEEVTLYTAENDAEFINSMIHEHKDIKHSLDVIDAAFSRGEGETLTTEIRNFFAVLIRHFNEEEEKLIPRISTKISEQEMESLISEAHVIESERKKSDVWSLFEYDHKRIDLNISRLRNSVVGSGETSERYRKMRTQLLTHIELEETVLFPAFAEITSPDHLGPVNVMIQEHQVITSYLPSPADREANAKALETLVDLIGRLAVHNKKEELILYPMINRELPRAEKERVFKECLNKFMTV